MVYGRWRDGRSFDLGHDAAEAARFPWVARSTGAPPRDRPPRPGERAP